MNLATSTLKDHFISARRLVIAVLLVLFMLSNLAADVVYVTSRPSPRGNGPNDDGTYNDNGFGDDTTALSSVPDAPPRRGSRYFSNSFSNSTPDFGITITPTLGLPGMIYQVEHTYSSDAGNVSSNIVMAVTNVGGCTLSFSNNINKFQAPFGTNSWEFLGYLTNAPGSATPIITFYYQSGIVSAGQESRLEVDCFKFTSLDPCLTVAAPSVTGPLFAGGTNLTVSGVSSSATNISVYQNGGGGMVKITSVTVTNPPSTVLVPVTGLVKSALVAATQKVRGQESCLPATGTVVGGGANPEVRMALSIRSNPDLTGPVGSTGGGTNANIYFLGAADILDGACPGTALILQPRTNWQTVTFTRGPDFYNPVDPVVNWNDGGGASLYLEGNFGALDGIAFACQGDNGPFDVYLDDLVNGTNGIVQNWEAATPDSTYGFVQPRASGSTSGNLLSAPDDSLVVTNTAFSGKQCLHLRWQFARLDTNLWLRLVTANANPVQNPQLDLNEPISFKMLLLRPGDPVPPPPAATSPGSIAIAWNGATVTLNWSGSFQLQASPVVTGGFTNVPGVMTGPYMTSPGPGNRFYRLSN
jgi:hypothetical protein